MDDARGEAALIATVDEAAAEGELAKVYRRIAGAAGTVAYILKSSSLHPAVLRRHYDLYREVMFGPSPLIRHDGLVDALQVDPLAAPVPARERALLRYAARLT